MSQIKKKFIENNAIDGSKIQLLNGQTLRAKDNSGEDRDLFYFSSSNEWYLSVSPKISADPQGNNDLVRKYYVDTQVSAEASSRAAAVSSEQSRAQAAESALDSRLDVLEGSNSTEGSVAKAEKDAKDYADQKIADLINGAPGVLDTLKELSDALGGDENFATTIANELASIQSNIGNLGSSSSTDLSSEESARMAADNALDARLDVIEGADTVAGSVAKSLKDAKAYADAQVSSEQSARMAADSTEAGTRATADSALSGRLDIVEGGEGVAGSVSKALKDAKDYTDAEVSAEESARMAAVSAEESARMAAVSAEQTARQSADSTLQSNINAEASSRAAAVSAEESARTAADDALDGRLDVIEGADTVAGSVAKAEKDSKAYADTKDALLQGQIDQLDGYTLDLRNDLDTEVSDRQSAVSAEQTARQAADSTLQSGLDAEQSARIAADSTEQTARMAAVSAEQTARQAADTAEQSARQAADAAEQSARVAAIVAEESARMAADSALDARLDIVEGNDSVSGSIAKSLKDSKDYTDTAVTNLVNAAPGVLDTLKELADAIGGDESFVTTVANNIASEASAREAADNTLQNNIDAEESARMSAVSAEQTSRIAADLSEQTARQAADATLQSNIDAEASARMAAVSAEQSARQAADTTLQSNIDAEVSRAQGQEAAIETRFINDEAALATEVSDRQAAVSAEASSRAAAVTAEASARQSADATLQSNIDAEQSARMAAVSTEESARMAADSAEQTARAAAVSAEASARQAADATLTTNLAQEVSDRQSAVSTEASARIAADATLQSNVDAEESARISADSTEQSARMAADSTLQDNIDSEQSRAEAAEAGLDGRLDVIEGADTVSGSVSKALKDAKAYTDSSVSNEASLRGTADDALQSEIDQLMAVVHEKQKFTLSSGDISNGYINLGHQAIEKSLMVMVDRLVAHADDDYTVSVVGGVTRVTFTGALVSPGTEALSAGDVVRVMYRYQG